jgi:serine/threonine protein kinase
VTKKLPSGWRHDDPAWSHESGQAWIYRVQRTGDAGRYALKRLENLTRRDRFAREVNAMIALRRQGLTAIPEVVEHDLGDRPWPYLVTPWYNDGSLADRITGGRHAGVIAELDRCRTLAKALLEVHQHGYAHRDLKPENILFDGDALRLGDFGLCLEVNEARRVTSTEEAVGSRYFIAPENEGGLNEANDQRPADFYAFGKLLWYILTGRPLPREQQLAAVDRVCADEFPPRRARTLTLSMAALDQSTWPSSPSQSSSRWCSCSQTPACCQSRSRRQQVTPLPQPSSRAGSSRQGTPARRT